MILCSTIIVVSYYLISLVQVYVIDYNVYLWNTTQPVSSPISITSAGTKSGVRYGIPDWVYEGITKYTKLTIVEQSIEQNYTHSYRPWTHCTMSNCKCVQKYKLSLPECLFNFFLFFYQFSEEVISGNHAVWWSGDGAALLYASFNDTFVEDYSFPMYGPFEEVYTTIIDIPYPKVARVPHVICMYLSCDLSCDLLVWSMQAGAANPTVALYVVNVSTPTDSRSLGAPTDIADM